MKYIISILIFVLIVVLGIFYFNKKTITNYPSKGSDIIAFGDSLVEGVGSTRGNNFVSLLSLKTGQPIINLGHSGDTTLDGLNRLNEIDNYNPKIVILLLGGNDYLKKVPLVDTRKNLATIIENIQKRGAIVILLGVRGGLLNDSFNKMFIELKNTYNTAYVSDVLEGLIGNQIYMSDAVHPNDIGYKKIADRIYPILYKILK